MITILLTTLSFVLGFMYFFVELVYFRWLIKKCGLENATHPDDLLITPIFILCMIWPLITIVQLFLIVWNFAGYIVNNIEGKE